MKTLDLKKKWKHLDVPSAKAVAVVDVPEFQFVMVNGTVKAGEPPQA